MPRISIVINADTRDGFQNEQTSANQMFDGCKSADFLTEGVINKRAFFSGFDTEVIVYVDEHIRIPTEILEKLNAITDTLIIRKHTSEFSFNDYNYLRALMMADGDIICHVDQDTNCFTSGKGYIEELISYLENYKFVSYPSHWTPYPIIDESFKGTFWASTRFFICKREALKLDELKKCIENPDWMYEKYGDSARRLNWTEHFLTKINNNSVFYPPVKLHKGAIFSWSSYKGGVLNMLNNADYEQVKQWIIHRGGIQYPVDVKCD